MVFQKIIIQNFFSFGEEEQELNLEDPGMYIITGKNMYDGDDDAISSNGSGKSTLFEAITFALFGKITKDVNLPNVVNERIGKNCKVELYFEINGTNYIIQRYRGHEKHYDKVFFYKDSISKENIISKANINDTQEEIEKLIKFNFKSFINAVMMSQENINGFLQSGTNSTKRKEIIENILQLSNITKYHWISQQKRKLARRNFEFLQREEENVENLINNTKESVSSYLNSCKVQEKNNNDEIEKLEKDLSGLDSMNIEEERAKIKEAEKISNLIEQKMTSYRHMRDDIARDQTEVESIESSQDEYKQLMKGYVRENKSLKESISSLKEKKEKIQSLYDDASDNPDSCPVCGGEINVHDHKEWLQQKMDEMELIDSDLSYKESKYDENKEKIENWMEKVKELEQQKRSVEDGIKNKKSEAKEIKNEYDSYEIPETVSEEELNKVYEKRSNIEAKINEKKAKEFVDKEYLNGLKNQISEYKKQLKDTTGKKNDAENRFIILRWWENALSSKKKSMKTWCINNIVGYFNARIKNYVDRFFDGSIEVTLDNDLNESIKFLDHDRSFGQFSGGEKRRLNLAILFALNSLIKANVSTKINIMFLDEVLSSHLDEKGISTVLEILDDLSDKDNSIFVIDHKDNFKDYPSFSNIQITKKEDGFSYIEG